MRSVLLSVLIFIFGARAVCADQGQRMLLIKCDVNLGHVTVQPFILWNDENVHEEQNLKDPTQAPQQRIGTSRYYAMRSGREDFVDYCELPSRKVRIVLHAKQLQVDDVAAQTKIFNADFDNGIGSAWDVSGPLYRLESSEYGLWKACKARHDPPAPPSPWVCEDVVMR